MRALAGSAKPRQVIFDKHDAAEYRARLTTRLADVLADGALVAGDAQALADSDIMREAGRRVNVTVAEDMHSVDAETGTVELFDTRLSLVVGSGRIDPAAMEKARRRNTKIVAEAWQSVKPLVGFSALFITLTMPRLKGIGYKLSRAVCDDAFRTFRKSPFFAENFQAIIKSRETTLGKLYVRERRAWSLADDGFHQHLHLLAWARSWLNDKEQYGRGWTTLGEEWKRCLEASARRHGVELRFTTEHGRPDVSIIRVAKNQEAKAIAEIAKYICKGSTLADLPGDQLREVSHALRGQRMIELLGDCNKRKGFSAAHRAHLVEKKSMVQQAQVVHTSATIDSAEGIPEGVQVGAKAEVLPPRRRRVEPLREMGRRLIAAGRRAEWLELLAETFERRRRWRREQLARRYPWAKFTPLEGAVWFGVAWRAAGAAAA